MLYFFFFFNDTATTEIYTLSLHDALPILNVAVTTLIFVCAAHELHYTTEKLTNYLVPNNWIGLTRNLLIFCGLMVPVAIYSGAFNL